MFQNQERLERSLRQAGLEMLARDVIAKLRPALLFERQHSLDCDHRVGATKFGGSVPDRWKRVYSGTSSRMAESTMLTIWSSAGRFRLMATFAP